MKLNIKKTIAFFVLLNSFVFFSSAQIISATGPAEISAKAHPSDSVLLDLVQKQTAAALKSAGVTDELPPVTIKTE